MRYNLFCKRIAIITVNIVIIKWNITQRHAAITETDSLTNVPILGFFPILPSKFPKPPPGLFTLWESNTWWSNNGVIAQLQYFR